MKDVKALVDALTLKEKADLTTGEDATAFCDASFGLGDPTWSTAAHRSGGRSR